MYELVKRNESLTNKIIHSCSDMQLAGVAVGNNSGRVWVDNLEDPISAIVWSEGVQGFQFMGCANNQIFNNQLKSFIEDTIFSFLKEKELDCFEFASDLEEWYSIIYNALSDREIKECWQYVYRSKVNLQKDVEAVLSKPYCLHQINESFISCIKNNGIVSNSEFLIDYIKQFWGSEDNYLNLGYGFAAIDKDKIASFAITSFLYRDTYSVGVETLEQFRRKGLASTLVKVLLKTLYSKNYNIWWDCMESNVASQGTAKSSGLIFDHKFKLCRFTF